MKKILNVILFLSVLLFAISCTEVTAPAEPVVADASTLYPAAPPMPGEESGDIVGQATQALVNDPTVCNEYAVVEKSGTCAPNYGDFNADNLLAIFPPTYTVPAGEDRNIMDTTLRADGAAHHYVYKYGWVFKNRQWQRFEWTKTFSNTYASDYPNEIFVGDSTTTPDDWVSLGAAADARVLTTSHLFNSDDAQKPNADNTAFLPFDFTDVNTDDGTAFVTAFICGCDGDNCRRQSGWHCNLHTDPTAPGAVQGANGLQMNGLWTITGSDLQEVNVVGAGPGNLGSPPSGVNPPYIQGSSWKVETASNKLEMANNNASQSNVIGETFRHITTFIGANELDELQDEVWSTNTADYNYNQFLFFDNADSRSGIVKYAENDDDITDTFLFFKNDRLLARYKAEFITVPESAITNSVGTPDSNGLFLDTFIQTKLTLLGQPYTVVKAQRTATGGGGVELVLMAGEIRDTLLELESNSYTIGGVVYDVKVELVDPDEAKFTVNGELTPKLKVGDVYTLSSGKVLGVGSVLYQDFAGGVHSTTFYIGTQRVTLRDESLSVSSGTIYPLIIGSEPIDGTEVTINGGDDNVNVRINSIEINMSTEDDYYVGPGEKLSDVIAAAGKKKEVLLGGAWDIQNNGLAQVSSHDIKLRASSIRRYDLQLFDGDGNAVNLPIAYANDDGGNLSMGRESGLLKRGEQERLILWENGGGDQLGSWMGDRLAIYKGDYFVVTGGLDTNLNGAPGYKLARSGSAKSYLLQYRGADAITKPSPRIQFRNLGDGNTLEYSVASLTTTGTIATINIGGYSFIVRNASSTKGGDDFQIQVDLDGNGVIASGRSMPFIDSYGSEWHFNKSLIDRNRYAESSWNNTEFIEIYQTTPNTDDYDNVVPSGVGGATGISLKLYAVPGPEVRASLKNMTLTTTAGQTRVRYGYSSMGTFFQFDEPIGAPQELTMSYPIEQRLPQVFVTAAVATRVS